MDKLTTFKDLTSYVTVRRNNWTLKLSVYKETSILVTYQHVYGDAFGMKYFGDYNKAADFIDELVEKD